MWNGGYGPGRMRDALVPPAWLAGWAAAVRVAAGPPARRGRRGCHLGSGDGSTLQEMAELGPAARRGLRGCRSMLGAAAAAHETAICCEETAICCGGKHATGGSKGGGRPSAKCPSAVRHLIQVDAGSRAQSQSRPVGPLPSGSALAPLRCFKVVLQVSVSGLTFCTPFGLYGRACPKAGSLGRGPRPPRQVHRSIRVLK